MTQNVQLFTHIGVGEPFNGVEKTYEEGPQIEVIDGGLILRIAYNNPSVEEIENIREGKPSFSVIAAENIIFFLCKFGELPWMDVPYNVHLSTPGEPLPTASFSFDPNVANTGIALLVVLLDAANGIVKALRLIGLPTGVSIRLKGLVDEQRLLPFEKTSYFTRLSTIYARYSTMDLVKKSFQENTNN